MRMWMVNPRTMCKQHLGGEHVELHMFVGSLRKKKSITGYIERNQLEPQAIIKRHRVLAAEIDRRAGLRGSGGHASDLPDYDLSYLPEHEQHFKINRKLAAKELYSRCPLCRARKLSMEKTA